jgi:Uncharacterized protein conserved in bacteria
LRLLPEIDMAFTTEQFKLPTGGTELIIFTMSDSSGETAESVARAALVQFEPGKASIYRLPQVRNSSKYRPWSPRSTRPAR